MSASDFELSREDGVYRLRGRLGAEAATGLWERRAELLKGSGTLILDLGELKQCDSAGLALLVNLLGETRRLTRELRLVRVPAQLLDLARVSGVDEILPLDTTPESV